MTFDTQIDTRSKRRKAKGRRKVARSSSTAQTQLSSEEFLLHEFWKVRLLYLVLFPLDSTVCQISL